MGGKTPVLIAVITLLGACAIFVWLMQSSPTGPKTAPVADTTAAALHQEESSSQLSKGLESTDSQPMDSSSQSTLDSQTNGQTQSTNMPDRTSEARTEAPAHEGPMSWNEFEAKARQHMYDQAEKVGKLDEVMRHEEARKQRREERRKKLETRREEIRQRRMAMEEWRQRSREATAAGQEPPAMPEILQRDRRTERYEG